MHLQEIMLKIIKSLLFILIICSNSVGAENLIIYGNYQRQPKIWLAEDGKPSGILVDILTYTVNKMGKDIKIELYPWPRAFGNAKNGSGGIIGISMSKERLKIFDYSDPIYFDEVIMVIRKENMNEFKNYMDLANKNVGTVKGSTFGIEYEKIKENFNIIEDSANDDRLVNLLLGKIDGAIFSPGIASVNFAVKNSNMKRLMKDRDKIVALKKPLVQDPNYLAFSKDMKMKSFLKEFNAIIKVGIESNEIQNIIEKY
jgi:polar amino acid transport system substrate-binding protein